MLIYLCKFLGEIVELEIIDCGSNGEGIAKVDGKVCFVDGALLGEIVDVEVTKSKANFCFCKLNKIIKASQFRQAPTCKYFGSCGGCNLMHIDYEEQKKIKRLITQNTINKISKLDLTLEDLKSCKDIKYRNKMVYTFDESGTLCMHSKDITLMPVDYCYLQCDGIETICHVVQKYVLENKLKGYNPKTKNGLLKYLVIRKLNEQYLITIVATKSKLPNINLLIEELNKLGVVYGLFVNKNTQNNSLILTNDFTKLFGIDYIQSSFKTINGKVINYTISPGSFLQVNDEIKELIYNAVSQELKDSKTIIDAYSGAGLLTAIMSSVCDQAVGIEVVKSASQDADRLKADNNISNMYNINSDCAVGFDKIPAGLINKGLSIILDPPRKGADQAVLSKVLALNPDKIVYISCNPATLARDLVVLSGKYQVKSITPYDMFAQTSEVECLACLERKEKLYEN